MKKNGFTLIELLATIIILIVIAMITVPVGYKYIEDSKYSAFQTSVHNFVKVLRNENMIRDYEGLYYTFPLPESNDLGMKGDTSNWLGEGFIDENGQIGMSISQGSYCAYKTLQDSQIKFEKKCHDLEEMMNIVIKVSGANYDEATGIYSQRYGENYVEPKIEAYDGYGRSIPYEVSYSETIITNVYPKTYTMTIRATDEMGRTGEKKVSIKIIDHIPPVITVEGHTSDYTTAFEAGNTYVVPSATVTDNSNESIVATVSGIVNGKVEGTYVLTYTAKDSSNNEAILKVTVIVTDNEAPEVTILGNPTSWTNQSVTIAVNATDDGSGLAQNPYSFDGGNTWTSGNSIIISSNQTLKVWVKDNSGNIFKEAVVIDKIDKTIPDVTFAVASGTAGTNYWYKSNVGLKITPTAGSSGVQEYSYCVTTEDSCTPGTKVSGSTTTTATLSSESIKNKVCVSVTSASGQTNSKCSSNYKIDKTAPVITVDGHTSNYELNLAVNRYIDTGWVTEEELNRLGYATTDSGVESKTQYRLVYTAENRTLKTGKLGEASVSSNSDWFSSSKKDFASPVIPLEGCYTFNYSYNTQGTSPSTSWGAGYTVYRQSDGGSYDVVSDGGAVGRPSSGTKSRCQAVPEEQQVPVVSYNCYGGGGADHNTQSCSGYLSKWYELSYDEQVTEWQDTIPGGEGTVGTRTLYRYHKVFEIPKATVIDNLTSNQTVTVSGNATTSILGSYPITYTATDDAGNTSTLVLTINVVEPSYSDWMTETELVEAGHTISESGIQTKNQYRSQDFDKYTTSAEPIDDTSVLAQIYYEDINYIVYENGEWLEQTATPTYVGTVDGLETYKWNRWGFATSEFSGYKGTAGIHTTQFSVSYKRTDTCWADCGGGGTVISTTAAFNPQVLAADTGATFSSTLIGIASMGYTSQDYTNYHGYRINISEIGELVEYNAERDRELGKTSWKYDNNVGNKSVTEGVELSGYSGDVTLSMATRRIQRTGSGSNPVNGEKAYSDITDLYIRERIYKIDKTNTVTTNIVGSYYITPIFGPWSEWQDSSISETAETKVETRTLYRYQIN